MLTYFYILDSHFCTAGKNNLAVCLVDSSADRPCNGCVNLVRVPGDIFYSCNPTFGKVSNNIINSLLYWHSCLRFHVNIITGLHVFILHRYRSGLSQISDSAVRALVCVFQFHDLHPGHVQILGRPRNVLKSIFRHIPVDVVLMDHQF